MTALCDFFRPIDVPGLMLATLEQAISTSSGMLRQAPRMTKAPTDSKCLLTKHRTIHRCPVGGDPARCGQVSTLQSHLQRLRAYAAPAWPAPVLQPLSCLHMGPSVTCLARQFTGRVMVWSLLIFTLSPGRRGSRCKSSTGASCSFP